MVGARPQEAVAVIGQGYVGLPLSLALARCGFKVHGVEIDSATVASLKAGASHIDDVSDNELRAGLRSGYEPSSDASVVASCQTVVLCVPTPLGSSHKPDLSVLNRALSDVLPHVVQGTLVVLESTSYPGTTEELVAKPLQARGFDIGKDVFVAFSPERIDPANDRFSVENTPRVVGGVTAHCGERARKFYSALVSDVHMAPGPREAEMAKLLENTYRHVNIALINEFAKVCSALGIDVWEVVAAAATKPFGYKAFFPGPGVGGHCIPIDPHYLNEKVQDELGYPMEFVELAYAVNSSMPAYVVDRVVEGASLRAGSRVLLIGVTYKPDVADTRETPALEIARRFMNLGCEVEYWDPLVPEWKMENQLCTSVVDPMASAQNADAVVLLQTNSLLNAQALASASKYLFDTRGVVGGPSVERL